MATLAFSPARANQDITGGFSGKTKCVNGIQRAGFKDPLTQNITWYTLNEIAHAKQELSWPDSSNPMSFDAREDRKKEFEHVLKILRNIDCDNPANPAQNGTGLQQGTVNATTNATTNATKNAVTPNSYVEPSQPDQR